MNCPTHQVSYPSDTRHYNTSFEIHHYDLLSSGQLFSDFRNIIAKQIDVFGRLLFERDIEVLYIELSLS